MKVVQENQKLKATIESYDRYYKQQQFDNYRKDYQQKFKKRRYYKPDSESENEVFIPQKMNKNRKNYIDNVDGYYVDDDNDDEVDNNEIEEVNNNNNNYYYYYYYHYYYENDIEDNNNYRNDSNVEIVKIIKKPKKKKKKS